ncbi:outer membrane beta-barrel protein [Sediminitomix flava]|uniref:Outer membrane protein with beta-barrel domain n=1 Tax=Sediminitomix flava TaxID=379075 RepID=A0A315ZAE6_SEDFL|nr:outer membrane beta-barrel protein [Sediminitomix flava]PWJ42033.1 outer membrane protein with beta-barrel domain [Sediminitomix flava]
MKLRYTFLFTLLYFSFTNLKAQDTNLSLGAHIGITSTSLTNTSSALDVRANAGALLGFRIKLEKRFFIQTGFDFYGSSIEFDSFESPSLNEAIEDDLAYNNFDIPLYIGYNFWYSKDKETYFRASAGGALSIFNDVRDNDLALRGSDFNQSVGFLKFGLGMNHKFITFDIYYDLGMNDLLKRIDGKVSRFSFTAGVQFIVIEELF